MPVCPGEAELGGCAITVLPTSQPPVLPAAQEELSHLWKLSVILPQICYSWILNSWFMSCSYHLDSRAQLPALLLKKNWKTAVFQLNKLSSNFYSYRWEDKLLWVQIIFQIKNTNKISIYHILPSVHNTLASNHLLPTGLHQATLHGYEAKPLISALLPSLSLKGHQPKIYYMASSQPLLKA